jgi:hypothetical protein
MSRIDNICVRGYCAIMTHKLSQNSAFGAIARQVILGMDKATAAVQDPSDNHPALAESTTVKTFSSGQKFSELQRISAEVFD